MSKRILGIDPGEKRIGVAISDEGRRRAVRLAQITGGEDEAEEIKRLATSYHIKEIVVGRARTVGGALGRQADKARELGEELAQRGFTIHYEDETATTDEAKARLTAEGVRRDKQSKLLDMVSAEIILQGWLDEHQPK